MKYKLVCFDLDGTIIDETIFIWQTLHDALGTDKDERQIAMGDFFAGKITYSQWAEYDFELWKKAGATKTKVMEALNRLRLMKGARETLEELKKRGLKLAIISGSLDFALEKVLPDYRKYFDQVFINKVIFKGEALETIQPTPFDFKRKADALKEICMYEGIDVSECVFVGDHDNDIYVAELAGLAIAFNCKSDKLAQIADVIIKKKDLREILKHI